MSDAVVVLRSTGRRWRAVMATMDDDVDVLRRRPSPDVLSALEHAARTRDALARSERAMDAALTIDHPSLPWPTSREREETPVDVPTVLDELAMNATRLADRVERVDAADWRRPATTEGVAEEAEVDALWFLHHAVHEATHHLKDAERALQTVRGR